MSVIYILIWGFVIVFGLTAVYGLVWAIRSGQMRDFAAGATSIFDDEEPVGEPTDAFPGETVTEEERDESSGDRQDISARGLRHGGSG